MNARLAFCVLAFGLGACGNSRAIEELVQCGTVDASSAACPADGGAGGLTYAQVEPLIVKSCVPCHDGMMTDVWPLTDYGDIAAWASSIKNSILDCSMPPADGGVPITNAERSALVQWVLCKTPR
jgi:hypothetical protein